MKKSKPEYISQYKDAFRRWWRLELKQTNRVRKMQFISDHIEKDYYWDYTLSVESEELNDTGGYTTVFKGRILGQLDTLPTITDVMKDYLNSQNALAFGFVRYGELIALK